MQENFETVFERIRPTLAPLEEERRLCRRAAARFWRGFLGIACLGAAGLIAAHFAGGPFPPLVFVGIGIAGLLAGLIAYQATVGRKKRAYRRRFKLSVISAILEGRFPELRYLPEGGVDIGRFRESNLFSHSPDRYAVEDGFSGKIGQTEVVLSEVKAQYRKTTTDSKGRTRTTYVTFFDGLFLVADFHKDFRGTLRVLPDTAERLLGGFGKRLQGFRPFSGEDLVYLEDPEFEKTFVVYGSDQVEARYILSTSLMRRILELRNRWEDDVRLGFRDSRVYVAISCRRNLLEPDYRKPADDPEPLRHLVADLDLCAGVVDELNLNTRIWSKS